MIQPAFTPLGGNGGYNNMNSLSYGQSFPSHNGGGGNGSDVNGGQNGSMQQQHSESGQQSQQSQQPDYSLAGVLHFLQTEWRRYERDRNEWEIERAEMRARVALLEGERRGVENLKTDLMRRVKMLEFALRQERSKYLASNNTASSNAAATGTTSITPVKNPLLQNVEKAATNSGRSSPAPETMNEPSHQRSMSTMSTNTMNSNFGTMNGLSMGGQGSTLNVNGAQLNRQLTHAKDPKARAKSREYLKQCLQEISYLTSASSLNPLPDRAIPSGGSTSGAAAGSIRPKKVLSEFAPPTPWASEPAGATNATGGTRRQRSLDVGRGTAGKAVGGGRGLQLYEQPLEERDEELGSVPESEHHLEERPEAIGETHISGENSLALDKESLVERHGSHGGDDASSSSSSSSDSSPSHGEDSSQSSTEEERQGVAVGDAESKQVTAIFRPGGKQLGGDDWAKLKDVGQRERERRAAERGSGEAAHDEEGENHAQLQATSNRVSQLLQASPAAARSGKSDEDELAGLTLMGEQDDETNRLAADAAAEGQMWKSKRVLRSHLDAVRAVVFDQTGLSLYSASDDNTIKFWKLDPATFKHGAGKGSAPTATDSDPIVTLRGHSAAVTCLALSASHRRLYSGSVDASIVVWKLVDGGQTEPYPPFDRSMELARLVGHSQPIWDLCLLPTKADAEGLLASASADGTVKLWSTSDSSLVLSFDYFGIDPAPAKEEERAALLADKGSLPVPTSVVLCLSDLRRCAVAYSNAVVKLFDVETGREAMQFASDEHYDGTEATQINKVLAHPTLPVLITGHENNYIQFFDMNTGACTLSMVAHLDSVTCLDMDPSGLTLASGGHDCSVRYWDYDGDKNTAVCVQEVTAHRKKSMSAEGVLQVRYHPSAPWFCSAGADGVIRLYG